MSIAPEVTELRLQLRKAGFHPIPVEGKIPPGKAWQTKFNTTTDEIRLWSKPGFWHLAHNTGIIAKFAPGIDIDIMIEAAAKAVEMLAREFFEEHGDVHVRFGLPPKRLIPLRTDEPFEKLSCALTAPDGSEGQKIEILGDGQQYVVDGIHPDTGKPYGWFGGDLKTIQRNDLPYVRREDAERFLDAAVDLLVRDFGYTRAPERPKRVKDKNGNGQFVNDQLANERDWEVLLANILKGDDLHESVRDLAAKLITGTRGVNPGLVVNLERALMELSSAPHDDRWQERFDDIPRAVQTALDEFAPEEEDPEEGKQPTIAPPPQQPPPGAAAQQQGPSQSGGTGQQGPGAAAQPISELFDPWQEFIVPKFPLAVLPQPVFDFVVHRSDAMGVDSAAFAMAMLASLSGAIHHRFRVKMKRKSDWWEHVRLWVLLVGRPSWKKSPIVDATTWPLEYYQADVMRDFRAELRDYQTKVKAGDKNAKECEPPERYIVGDTTSEKLGEILSRNERGVLAVHDEVAGWIGRMERYNSAGKGASADRAFWLRAWNGGPYTIDRVKSGETVVRNLSVSIVGGIQPARLAEIHGLTSDGLLQRFLPVLMQAPMLPMDIDCSEVNKNYKALIYELIRLPPQELRTTDAAIEAMDELQHHLFNLEQVGEALSEGFEGFVGKLAGYAGVLTIILHLIDNPRAAVKNFIGKPLVEKVDRLIREFLIPHAYEFYSVGEGGSERLRKLASYVLTCGKNRLRLAEFTNNVWECRGKTVLEINQQVSPLVAGGWLVPLGQGPAYRVWDVNRAVIDAQFADRCRSEQERKVAMAATLGWQRRRV